MDTGSWTRGHGHGVMESGDRVIGDRGDRGDGFGVTDSSRGGGEKVGFWGREIGQI